MPRAPHEEDSLGIGQWCQGILLGMVYFPHGESWNVRLWRNSHHKRKCSRSLQQWLHCIRLAQMPWEDMWPLGGEDVYGWPGRGQSKLNYYDSTRKRNTVYAGCAELWCPIYVCMHLCAEYERVSSARLGPTLGGPMTIRSSILTLGSACWVL